MFKKQSLGDLNQHANPGLGGLQAKLQAQKHILIANAGLKPQQTQRDNQTKVKQSGNFMKQGVKHKSLKNSHSV